MYFLAFNRIGPSTTSEAVVLAMPLAGNQPSPPEVRCRSGSELHVGWGQLPTFGDVAVLGYRLFLRPRGSAAPPQLACNLSSAPTAAQCVVPRLQPDTACVLSLFASYHLEVFFHRPFPPSFCLDMKSRFRRSYETRPLRW